MEKANLGFRIYKIWQILKRFAGTFCQAQTLKLGGVYQIGNDVEATEIPEQPITYLLGKF